MSFSSRSSLSCGASVSTSKRRRISAKPTGASLSTPSVPRKSRSPSAVTSPLLQRHLDGGRHRFQGHAGAGDQGFQQHVAGAEFESGAAGRRVQAGHRQRAAGLDLAGDAFVVDRALGFQRDHRGLGIGLVALLDRGLHGAEFGGVHFSSPGLLPDIGCTGSIERDVTMPAGARFPPAMEIHSVSIVNCACRKNAYPWPGGESGRRTPEQSSMDLPLSPESPVTALGAVRYRVRIMDSVVTEPRSESRRTFRYRADHRGGRRARRKTCRPRGRVSHGRGATAEGRDDRGARDRAGGAAEGSPRPALRRTAVLRAGRDHPHPVLRRHAASLSLARCPPAPSAWRWSPPAAMAAA